MSKKRGPSIAFIVPAAYEGQPSIITERMVSYLIGKIPDLYFRIYRVGTDARNHTYSAVATVIENDYDLLVTFNSYASLMAQKLIKSSGSSLKLLFSGTPFPQEYGLIESIDAPEGNTTGVCHSVQDIKSYCEFIYECLPQMKRVLLPMTSVNYEIDESLFIKKPAVRPPHFDTLKSAILHFFK